MTLGILCCVGFIFGWILAEKLKSKKKVKVWTCLDGKMEQDKGYFCTGLYFKIPEHLKEDYKNWQQIEITIPKISGK